MARVNEGSHRFTCHPGQEMSTSHEAVVDYVVYPPTAQWPQYEKGILLTSLKEYRWCGGATGRALDLRSIGHGFKSYSGQRCITTLDKLFTPMCLCHQAV